MTIGELKEILAKYRDDAEIFVGQYNDLHGDITYSNPMVSMEKVDAAYSKSGHLYYSKWRYPKGAKQHMILIIE